LNPRKPGILNAKRENSGGEDGKRRRQSGGSLDMRAGAQAANSTNLPGTWSSLPITMG
jgi:hypothetical protein